MLRINGILREVSIKNREFDGKDVVLDGPMGVRYATPDFEEKNELLYELFEKTKELNNVSDIATLIGISINAIHPFADGNGRTSRLFYKLIHDGYDKSEPQKEKISQILKTEGRGKIDLSPMHIREYIISKLKDENYLAYFGNPILEGSNDIRDKVFPENISAENKEKFIRLIEDGYSDFGLIAIYLFLMEENCFDLIHTVEDNSNLKYSEELDVYIVDSKMKSIIYLDEIILKLNNKSIEQILRYNRDAKSKCVRLFYDVIVNPNKYPFPDESGWNSFHNIKEFLEHKLRIRYKSFYS